MIATILPGSSNFHAVGYNEHKVSKGDAILLEMRNFESVGLFGPPTTAQKVEYLQTYSARNERIKKAQFHVAISCRGQEMSETELLEFAHDYMKEMGYMQEGQPMLIYAHRDTANNHLHIITSRIAPDGHKIAHQHERRRSQEVIDRLMKINRGKKIDDDIEKAMHYSFASLAQFKAILNSMGYEAYGKESEDELSVKFGGRVQTKIKIDKIARNLKKSKISSNRRKQLRQILLKYRDESTTKEDLQKILKKKFGLDLVFFGKKDSPFGYMIIDHSNKQVIHGGRILSLDKLLDFVTPEERMNRIEAFIDDLLLHYPTLPTSAIHPLLFKKYAYVKNGILYYRRKSRPLRPEVAEQIKRNNKIKWISAFRPTSEQEAHVLCDIVKLKESDRSLINISEAANPDLRTQEVEMMKSIADDISITSVRKALLKFGYFVRSTDDSTFIINLRKKTIFNITAHGFNIDEIQMRHRIAQRDILRAALPQHRRQMPGSLSRLSRLSYGGGGHSANREWEVGSRSDSASEDDSFKMKI